MIAQDPCPGYSIKSEKRACLKADRKWKKQGEGLNPLKRNGTKIKIRKAYESNTAGYEVISEKYKDDAIDLAKKIKKAANNIIVVPEKRQKKKFDKLVKLAEKEKELNRQYANVKDHPTKDLLRNDINTILSKACIVGENKIVNSKLCTERTVNNH